MVGGDGELDSTSLEVAIAVEPQMRKFCRSMFSIVSNKQNKVGIIHNVDETKIAATVARTSEFIRLLVNCTSSL